MLGYRLFGYNALGLRFYSALSMMLTMIVLALWTGGATDGLPACVRS